MALEVFHFFADSPVVKNDTSWVITIQNIKMIMKLKNPWVFQWKIGKTETMICTSTKYGGVMQMFPSSGSGMVKSPKKTGINHSKKDTGMSIPKIYGI